ncbi:hypothetical protein SEPCBS57363_004979 [Sporothrix epigloea]|uniref:Phospholipid-binding protein n=1 Tax=Sporothrix epigloea TaxID=1892477 RepID=A0ABP0DUZ9_9PEZI
MAFAPKKSGAAGPSSDSIYSATRSQDNGPIDTRLSAETSAAYSPGYSFSYNSFPSAAQSPPTTSSTMRPSLSGLVSPSTAYPPRQSIPFSHEDTDKARLAYETLATSAKAYRVVLGQLSTAASNFGSALEACARLKEARAQPYPPGPYAYGGSSNTGGGGSMGLVGSDSSRHDASCTADVLLATSGLHYLIANQQGILAETVYRSFELPIVHELDRYSADVEAEQESYAAGMREASRAIRRLEKEGQKLRKPRQRDVGRMRSHLVAMTDALDALTMRQGEHAVALLDQSRDMSSTVSQASRNLVRAEVDILDSLARKGWPGGGLDVVLDGAVDPFSRDECDDDGGDGLGISGSILLGGTSHSAGMVGGSSHAVVSGSGSILGAGIGDRGYGPRPLLPSTGGSVAWPSVRTGDDLSVDEDAEDDGHDGDNDEAEYEADDDGVDKGAVTNDGESEVCTINGNHASSSQTLTKEASPTIPSSSGGGFFGILTGGGILGNESKARAQHQDQDRTDSASSRRGRSPCKDLQSSRVSQKSQVSRQSRQSLQSRQSRQSHKQSTAREPEDEGFDSVRQRSTTSTDTSVAPQTTTTKRRNSKQPRYTRAESLSFEPAYQHQYQSLDSLANVEAASIASAAGSDTASMHTRGASSSRQKPPKGKTTRSTAGSRGRSRPFSPQRVSVDPQEDLFTGQFSGPERAISPLAWLKEGEQLVTPQEEAPEIDGEISQGHADENSLDGGAGKGKGKLENTEPPTKEPPTRRLSEAEQQETDEGVQVWRQDE